jgi:nucleoside-diphosphate-sugar epimerase
MTALVTGATGFLGSYIVRQLLADKTYTTIRCIRRSDKTSAWIADIADKVEWHTADLNDIFALEDALKGVQHIYHAAAAISFASNEHSAMLHTNIQGTANIVNAALTSGCTKFAHVSSVAALGRNKESTFFDENNKWQNDPLNTAYGISKFYAEQEVWRGAAEGLKVVIVNPSIIVGAFDWNGGSPALIKTIANGLKFYTQGSTGFVDVRDVATAIAMLMQSNITNERFILNGKNASFQTFFNQTADALGVARPNIKVTPLLGAIAWRVEWLRSKITGKKSLITKETTMTSSHHFEYSSQKFLKAFSNFNFIILEKTIQDTAKCYKSNKINAM